MVTFPATKALLLLASLPDELGVLPLRIVYNVTVRPKCVYCTATAAASAPLGLHSVKVSLISVVTCCAVLIQYGRMAEQCCVCRTQFGLLQRRHNCVICGTSVCEKCSSHDLVVFVPDEDATKEVSPAAVAKLAVIRVVGVCDQLDIYRPH